MSVRRSLFAPLEAHTFLKNLSRIATSHTTQGYGALLDKSAEILVSEVRGNIDDRRNAGAFRVDDAGTTPGTPMDTLSDYTLRKREQQGIFHDHPLKATGEMYRSIKSIRPGKVSRNIGAKTEKNQKKLYAQLGTLHTDIVSSDKGTVIPPRNPVGFSKSTGNLVVDMFLTAFGAKDRTTTKIKIDI